MKRCVHQTLAMTVLFLLVAPAIAEEPSSWVAEVRGPQYFAVRVADVDKSTDWYCTTFGLEKLDDTEADDGSWRIVNLHGKGLSVELIRDARAQRVDRAQGFFKVGFQVADVGTVADRVERATKKRPRIVDDTRHGIHILQLKDPDGNTIQLSSPLDKED